MKKVQSANKPEHRHKHDVLKQRVQRIIVSSSILIMICKFGAFFITNSVGILTDAMESIVNVIAGLVTLYSLYLAAKPKDRKHPFGYGKIELISASIEGILILIAGFFIIFAGIKRLFAPAEIAKLDIGIIVVAVAGAANYLLGWWSIRAGKRHDSIALIAGGKHLQSDTYSSIGLVLGLILLYATKINWIDSALAIIFGSIIAVTGIGILRKTVANLMDAADKGYLEKMLAAVTDVKKPEWIDIHDLKIIKYGSNFYIDCDLTVPWYHTVARGHEAAEELKEVIRRGFSDRITLSVHLDPCMERHCVHCTVSDCPYRRQPFAAPLTYTLDDLTEPDEERNE